MSSLAYLQGSSPRFCLRSSQRWPGSREQDRASGLSSVFIAVRVPQGLRNGVRIEFEITCSRVLIPCRCTALTAYSMEITLVMVRTWGWAPILSPHPTPILSCLGTACNIICHWIGLRSCSGLCGPRRSPSGPSDIHIPPPTSPRSLAERLIVAPPRPAAG